MFLKKKKKKVDPDAASEATEMATESVRPNDATKKQRPGQKASGKLKVGIGANESGDVDDV